MSTFMETLGITKQGKNHLGCQQTANHTDHAAHCWVLVTTADYHIIGQKC